MQVLANRLELKDKIKQDFVTLKNFSNKSELNDLEYRYLMNTLNGIGIYNIILITLERFGYKPDVQNKIRERKKYTKRAELQTAEI